MTAELPSCNFCNEHDFRQLRLALCFLCHRKPGKARGIIVDEDKEPGEDGRYTPLDQYNKFIWEIPDVTPEIAMLTVDERKEIVHAIYAARQGPLICKHCEEDVDEIPYFCDGCLAGLVQCAATALNRGKKLDFTSTPGFYPLKMTGNQSYSKIWQQAKKHWNVLEPEEERATCCQLCTRFIANEATGLCAIHDINYSPSSSSSL